MARKVRRVRKSRVRNQPPTLSAEETGVEAGNRRDAAEQFQLEYAYVLKDLRKILMLAAAMFLLLILLNILLRAV